MTGQSRLSSNHQAARPPDFLKISAERPCTCVTANNSASSIFNPTYRALNGRWGDVPFAALTPQTSRSFRLIAASDRISLLNTTDSASGAEKKATAYRWTEAICSAMLRLSVDMPTLARPASAVIDSRRSPPVIRSRSANPVSTLEC